jgi:hypothetical protein
MIIHIKNWDKKGNPQEYIEEPDGSFLDAYNGKIVTREFALKMGADYGNPVCRAMLASVDDVVLMGELEKIKWFDHGRGRFAGYFHGSLILRQKNAGSEKTTYAVLSSTNEPFGDVPIVRSDYSPGYHYMFSGLLEAGKFILELRRLSRPLSLKE